MKIESLRLKNFRKYEDAHFLFHPRFTILIGENGSGKTTVLDALAIMLATYFQGSKIKIGNSTISKSDQRFVLVEKGEEVFFEPQNDVYLEASGIFREKKISWRREVGDRGGKAKELVCIGMEDRQKTVNREYVDLPVFLYYGSGRLWDVHRHIETENPKSQWDSYRFCLDPKSDQKAFQKWFKKLSFSKMQKQESSCALEVIRHAVVQCIPNASDFFHDIVLDEPVVRFKDYSMMLFNNLSDGYRNMVAMVADIAHRAWRLNPHFLQEAARKTSGVVLIDEIDLHLHPKWQRTVVEDLQKAFPNLQFIGTTHSPFIIQSMASGEVIDIQELSLSYVSAEKDTAFPPAKAEYSNRSIEDIVEEIMGVDIPQRSHRYQKMYEAAKQYYEILAQGENADDEKKELLKTQLDELSAPYSDSVAYHAFLEMERATSKLKRGSKEEK